MTEQAYKLLEHIERNGRLDASKLTEEERKAFQELISMGCVEQCRDSAHNPPKVLCEKPKHEPKERREKRRYYRNLVLAMVTSLGVGLVFSALFKTLGLFGFLLGALLLLAGYFLAVLS